MNKWWGDKSDEIQLASSLKDIKDMHNLLGEFYGTSTSAVAPLRTEHDKELLRFPDDILLRWSEKFDQILNRHTQVEEEYIKSISEKPVKKIPADPPTFEEVESVSENLMVESDLEWRSCMPIFLSKEQKAITTGFTTRGKIDALKLNSLFVIISHYL